jgi:hypothetical protein
MEDLDEIIVEKQTLVHIAGMPFWIPAGTVIKGRIANYNLALKDIAARESAILNMPKVEMAMVGARIGHG